MSNDPSDILRAFGLTYPGAETREPWPGHKNLVVKGKTFAFLSVPGEPFSISCKLPFTGPEAVEGPDCEPTGYGLGAKGWVTARPQLDIPLELFKDWIDESYRAQAPKGLIKRIARPAP